MAYHYHMDGDHGWLEVPLVEVESLGLSPSRYSYQNENDDGEPVVLLEEDCDMARFLEAKKSLGEEVRIEEHYEDGESVVRSFARYGEGRVAR